MAGVEFKPRTSGAASSGLLQGVTSTSDVFIDRMPHALYRLALATAVIALCVAISTQSFWIDEANTAWRASEPSFIQLLRRMVSDLGSDAQMPLFLTVIWGWEKLFGHGEVALRAMNLVWLIPGLFIFANNRPDRLLVASASAFLWFYVNEARPYGMQIGASLMVFGLLERAVMSAHRPVGEKLLLRPHEAWLLVIGLILLSGSTLLGAIWAVAAVAAAIFAVPPGTLRRPSAQLVAPSLVLASILLPLFLYYAWTVLAGAGGTKVAVTDLRNLVFAFYELLGAAGLGPGRNTLRDAGGAAFGAYLPGLAIYILLVSVVSMAGMLAVLQHVPRRAVVASGLALAAAAAVILMAGYILHWRVVGRHLAPAIVVVLAVQAAGVSMLWHKPIGKLIVVGFLLAAFTSAVEVRYAERHAKDDYRTAAQIARSARSAGERVWWNADALGALVYDLPLGDGCSGALYLSEPPAGFATTLMTPNLVITSKQDIYDPSGHLEHYLVERQFRVAQTAQAFQIWRRDDAADVDRCSPGT